MISTVRDEVELKRSVTSSPVRLNLHLEWVTRKEEVLIISKSREGLKSTGGHGSVSTEKYKTSLKH